MSFPPHDISAPFDFPQEEEKVIAYWREIDAFQTSLKLSEGKPEFSFYDGPPFATGLPHYGHLLTGTIKDIVTRHAHVTGHHVTRRFGWDTHGVPVEHIIDKKLQVTCKDDVMKMGIDKYNAECRKIVMLYAGEWRTTVERMGRWIDFDNDYKTLNTSFMESVWWAFSELFKKDLVYRAFKVMPYSTGLTTPLSNFESGLDYRDINDPAVTVAFPLIDDPKTSLLAWTTTPWTLPSNLALCVHPDFTYLKIHDQQHDQNFILHEKLLKTLYKDPKKAKFTKVGSYKGSEMKGWRYVPLFDYFTEQFGEKAFVVLVDGYVTDESGTGIVHQAPAFGADDHRIAIDNGILTKEDYPPCPVNDVGVFTSQVPDFEGMNFKAADGPIQKALKAKGRLIVHAQSSHSYPFCWRSGTPLMYRVIPSWCIRVTNIIDELVANNNETRWVPQNIGDNRFGNWLANAIDWNVSRNRYWATPIPLWTNDDFSEIVCVGSIEELERLSGATGLTDIHRDHVDKLTIPSRTGGPPLKRIEEVFDCWFESGSLHYPFENKDLFEKTFPADFVCEGLDQTRGWFYTLLVISTFLKGTAPWKNLIVNGLVLAEASTTILIPKLVINNYGADAMRMYLVNSPVVRKPGVREVWLNSFRFFIGHANIFKKSTGEDFKYNPHAPVPNNVFDRWILARCQSLIKLVIVEMEAYRLYTIIPRLLELIDELTNWYIRFNRKRLKGEDGAEDTKAALNTLFEALFTLCRTMSSYTPFLTENIYQSLRSFIPDDGSGADTRSVHFLAFPTPKEEYFDPVVERQVGRMQKNTLSLKTPLKELYIFHADPEYLADVQSLQRYIESELNVRDVVFSSDEAASGIEYKVVADWPVLGRKLRKDLGRVKNALPNVTSGQVRQYIDTGSIVVDGIQLVEGDLTVQRNMQLPAGMTDQFSVHTDNDVVVRLDIVIHPELQGEWLAREMTNRVQRFRKKAGLQATDEVEVYYEFKNEEGGDIVAALKQHEEFLRKTLGAAPRDIQHRAGGEVLLEDDTQKIGDTEFRLVIVKA
ncbi:isoleucine-tRNA ligase [Flagelloscypha sp. PMI_526]|nr:isoleucine-tRNA ligase [Flagelloscypha sp. PMI_526]